MAIFKDILFTDDNQYLVEKGDFATGESDGQHQKDIVYESPGAYKQYPVVGVGIINYLNAAGVQLILKKNIRIQLEGDGYRVNLVVFEGDGIEDFTIDSERN
jgi:hypothetical protein